MQTQLYEHIEKKRVEQLIKSIDIDADVKKQLKSYLKNYDQKNKGFRVEYETRGLMVGRKYAKGSLSLQNFKKAVRETLVYDTHTDIDIVNCHLVLLQQYCEKNGLVCDKVNDYVNNRTTRLQQLITLFKIERKTAKELILVMMYGGCTTDYCSQHDFDVSINLPKWVTDLEKEFGLLTERISAIEGTIFNDVKKLKKKEYMNKKSSCLSYVLQVVEDKIITNAVTKLRQKGYVVDTLCFDGVLVNGIDIGEDLLEELSAYCFETTEYRVEFSVKQMVKHYEVAEEEYDFSDFEFMHLDEYNQVYCASLTGDTAKEIYEIRKAYIEKFLCKVQQPEPLYMFQNGIHTKVDPQNPTQIALLLKPITSGYFKSNGTPIPFYDHWSVDVKHRLYRAIDFIPFNIDKPIDDPNIYNVFEGFNPDIYGEAMEHDRMMKKITPYLDLVNALCDGEENASYFHKFIANIFQEPSNKPPVAIIFKGKQGTGKNMVLDAIGNMLNKTHYITSSKPSDFFGEHAEGYYRKLLVNLNEAEGKDTFDFEGRMKSLISEDTMTINPKNVRPTEIANHARTVVTTQKPSPVAIDVKTKDRRWVVYQTTDLYLTKSGKFWGQLYKHLRKPETMKALYQYFMSIDLTDFDWIKRRPMTRAYKEMCNLFSPIEALFFEEFYDKQLWMNMGISGLNCEEITVPMQDLFVEYESFCKRNRFLKDDTKATSSRSFVAKLVDLELPIVRLKTMGNNSIRLNPEDVYNFCDKKRWINGYKDDIDEAEYIDTGEDAQEGYFD